MSHTKALLNGLTQVFRDAVKVSLSLFRIMIPVVILVRILQTLGWIEPLAVPFKPLMALVGLPAEMGIVWVTAMVNNLYGAIVVFVSLIREVPVTTAQATILATMMLIAHTLPVELRIAQKSGPRLLFQGISRVGAALVLGGILHLVYTASGRLQGPAKVLFTSDEASAPALGSWLQWARAEAWNLFSIFLIVLALFFLMRLLKELKVIALMDRLLGPLLRFMGIGPKASAITVIGLTTGLAYGGGLIIHEARSGQVEKKDVFFSLTLMGLCHSLIEDTMLMVMIGADLSGILWARLVFAILAVALVVRVTRKLPEGFCDRFLWGAPK
jgi:hypothetical protein